MLTAVIQVKDYQSAKQQLQQALQVDAVELRLDYAHVLDFEALAKLRDEFHLPMIFTLRKSSQGGFYKLSEAQRLKDILNLCQLRPEFIDLEYDVPDDFLRKINHHYSTIKLICSYHNFNETPPDLLAILQSMQRPCFHFYKIATQANTTLDALRMLQLVNTINNSSSTRITGICMGEYGQCTRILSPVVGNAMTYVSIDDTHSTASGQLTLNEILKTYHFRNLNTQTKIYAVLGDPIHSSVGHILHNQAIEILKENAIYVKLRTTQAELPNAIHQCRQLPFFGFSITMPLKETVLSHIDDIDRASKPIKAVNTIVNHQQCYRGINTDGIGAMNALAKKTKIAQQTIVILGAGGAARAIAYAALQRHAQVIILNRTVNKAKQLANEFGCAYGELNELHKYVYHILINTLPASSYADNNMRAWLSAQQFLTNTIAMDIVYPQKNTAFLQHAQQFGCTCLMGYEMYIEQAAMQIQHWFQPEADKLQTIKEMMIRYFTGNHIPL